MDISTKNKFREFICGDISDLLKYPIYRYSYYLTQFFQEIGINDTYDGSTGNK